MQLPAMQTSSTAQRLAQPPQLSGSEASFTQAKLLPPGGAQSRLAGWLRQVPNAEQLPLTHSCVAAQTVLSAPQWFGSL